MSNIYICNKLCGGMEKHLRKSSSFDYFNSDYPVNASSCQFKPMLNVSKPPSREYNNLNQNILKNQIPQTSVKLSKFERDEIENKIILSIDYKLNELKNSCNDKFELLNQKIEIIRNSFCSDAYPKFTISKPSNVSQSNDISIESIGKYISLY